MRALAFLFVVAAVAGCRPEGQCAIDSDCPIPFRCSANQCTALAPVDSGGTLDAASADAGTPLDTNPDTNTVLPADTGPMPDANTDVGPSTDAFAASDVLMTIDAPVDAFSSPDAFVDPCPALDAEYSVSSASRGCLGVTATRVMFSRPGRACTYDITSDDDISGAVSLASMMLSGALTVGSRSYPSCTITRRTTGQVTIACGTCTVALLPLP